MILASRFLRLTSPYMEGPDIMAVQRRLISLGFYTGQFNGIYDEGTEEAVIRFEQANGLRPDGIVGPLTWTALGLGDVVWGGGQYHISVDTDSNILTLFDNGKLTRTYPVATGKPATPTPLGSWLIIEKSLNPGPAFGPVWMRLSVPNGGYAIHGTDNPSSIGRSVSHGCIRMYDQDASAIYNTVPVGTLVTITGRLFTTRVLRRGVTPGQDIAEAQHMLQVLGYYKGDIDGVYGSRTISAVRAFQSALKLSADGVVGPNTAINLQARYDIALGDVQP